VTLAERKLERQRYADDRARAAFYWEARKDGLVVRAQWDLDFIEHPLRELEGLAPYEFHAIPYRSTQFKAAFIPIEPGQKPIWLHHVNTSINLFVPGDQVNIEALCFGREFPDGRQEIMLVLPDGTAAGFKTVDESQAAFFGAIRSLQERLPQLSGPVDQLIVRRPSGR